jgi:hypothetical protein
MVQIVERVQAHYEAREIPFGKVYEWHSEYVALECECGAKVAPSATSTITTCGRCGFNLGAFVHGTTEREVRLPHERTHPWFYDAKVRAQQHQRDDEAYPEGSPWRYNDITTASNEE